MSQPDAPDLDFVVPDEDPITVDAGPTDPPPIDTSQIPGEFIQPEDPNQVYQETEPQS